MDENGTQGRRNRLGEGAFASPDFVGLHTIS